MSNTNHTLIVTLLDASGSMGSIKAATLTGLNNLINDQKTAALGNGVDRPIDLSPDLSGSNPLTANFTLITFTSPNQSFNWGQPNPIRKPAIDSNGEPKDHDHLHTIVHDNVNIHDVPPLTEQQYITDGGTPLIDAFCKAIEDIKRQIRLMPEAQRPGRVMFVCITDGEENTSKRFTRTQLNEKIKEQTDNHNWQFVFLGANQDAIAEAQAMGASMNNSMSFAANDAGITRAFASTSQMLVSKRYCAEDTMSDCGYAAADYAAQDAIIGSAMNSQHLTQSAGSTLQAKVTAVTDMIDARTQPPTIKTTPTTTNP